MPSSLSDGSVGPATAAAVQTFMGVTESSPGVFTATPEKYPVGSDGKWYRRGTPLTLAEGISGLVATYTQHPVAFGVNSGTVNSFVADGNANNLNLNDANVVNNIGCLILAEIAENVPASFGALIQVTLGSLIDALLAPAMDSLSC